MNLGWPAAVLDTLGGISDLLARLPQIERSVSDAAAKVQATLDRSGASLDDILERLRPMEAEIERLRKDAGALDSRLEGLDLDGLDDRFVALTEAANRLDGGLVHVLDRVPGLSAGDARDRAEEPN